MIKSNAFKKGTKDEKRIPFVRIVVLAVTSLSLIARLAANIGGDPIPKPDDLKKINKHSTDTIVILIKDSINIKKGS